MMTAAALIAKLQEMPGDNPVVVRVDGRLRALERAALSKGGSLLPQSRSFAKRRATILCVDVNGLNIEAPGACPSKQGINARSRRVPGPRARRHIMSAQAMLRSLDRDLPTPRHYGDPGDDALIPPQQP